jgi:hypothetical protein
MRTARGTIGTEIALALIALAIAVRMIVAPGYMPVQTAQGVTISLCTANGPVDVELPGKAPAQKAHDPCPFGAAAVPPLLPDAPRLDAPLHALVGSMVQPRPALYRPHLGAPAPPPPARAPPAFA